MSRRSLFVATLLPLLLSSVTAFSQSKDFVWSPPDGKSNTESVSQSSPPVAECVPSSPFISSRSDCSVSCGDGTLTVQWSNVCTSWQTSEACTMPSCKPNWKIMGLYRDVSQVQRFRPFGDWPGHFDDPVILPISNIGDQWILNAGGGDRWGYVTYLQMSAIDPPTLMTSTTTTTYTTGGAVVSRTTKTGTTIPDGFMPVYDRGTCAFPTQDGTYYLNEGTVYYIDKSSNRVYSQYVESFDFKAICRSDGTYDIYLAYYQNNIPNALLPNGQWPSGYPAFTYMGNYALQPGFMKDWAMQMWRLPYQKWVKTTNEKYFTSPFTYQELLAW